MISQASAVPAGLAWTVAGLVLLCSAHANAAGINTDTGLLPREGGSIFRLQFRYTDIEHDPSPANRRIRNYSVPLTVVYGLREDTSLFFTAPYIHRDVDFTDPDSGRRSKTTSDGIGDLTFFVKRRFWRKDAVLGTFRWAGIGGIQLRSGDREFSSDSYDPLVGTVVSWVEGRHWLDADLVYQFNTGRDAAGIDSVRYDLAYSYRLFPEQYGPGQSWEFRPVAELNGEYGVDGSHRLFLSPGLQFTKGRVTVEASIELPVVQHLTGSQPDEKFRLVIGMRLHF